MHSVQISRFGGPEVLKRIEGAPPQMTPDGIRVGVKAAGLNFADLMMRMGLYPEAPKPPFVPGYEVAGEVLEVGSRVTAFRTGDRVVAPTKFGGYTSEIVLPETQVRKIPARMSFTEAAAIPVNYLTAWVALQEMGRVRPGDRVLIPTAAGGVGTAAVQIAARAGAHVVGMVGSPSKADLVKALGAHEVLMHDEWLARDDKDAGGYDIILDAVGGKHLKTAFRRLKPTGRVIGFGASSIVAGPGRSLTRALKFLIQSPIYTPFKLMMASKGVFGLNMLTIVSRQEEVGLYLDRVLEGFEKGHYKTIVGKTFPFEEAGLAHSELQGRGSVGKVVLTNA